MEGSGDMQGRAAVDLAVQAMADLVRTLSSQDRALDNARLAATRLSRQRVEREEVELFLADRDDRSAAGPGDQSLSQIPHPRAGNAHH